MIIYGKKIILRAMNVEDADLLLDIINDPDTEKMLGGSSYPVSYDMQCEWIKKQKNNNEIFRAIIALQDNMKEGIGTVILNNIDLKNGTAEVHIKMSTQSCRGKGYGTDALNTVVDYAFNEMRLNCVYAEVLEYNTISLKLFEKCNFIKEGVLRERVFKNGKFVNIVSFAKINGD